MRANPAARRGRRPRTGSRRRAAAAAAAADRRRRQRIDAGRTDTMPTRWTHVPARRYYDALHVPHGRGVGRRPGSTTTTGVENGSAVLLPLICTFYKAPRVAAKGNYFAAITPGRTVHNIRQCCCVNSTVRAGGKPCLKPSGLTICSSREYNFMQSRYSLMVESRSFRQTCVGVFKHLTPLCQVYTKTMVRSLGVVTYRYRISYRYLGVRQK